MVTETKLTQARAARASSILMLIFFRIPAALVVYAKQAASEPRRARSARRDRLARRSPARSTAGARGRLKAGT